MKILTSDQMRSIDRRAVAEAGIPGILLMENAAIRITSALVCLFPEPRNENIVIVAGKGNNGGDGLAVARHLRTLGARPSVLLLAAMKEVRGDAAVNLNIALNLGVPVVEIRSPQDWKRNRKTIRESTIIVDALFGTGLAKPLEGLLARVVGDINAADAFKISVDIPSGLCSDTAAVIGPCVRADLTVALAAPKIAHVLPPAEEFVGDLVVAPIGLPPSWLKSPDLKLDYIEREDILPCFRRREKDTHKGTFGHVLAIAGSFGKTGAASLAGRAALRTGAGLVTVAVPESCLAIVARSMPELMTEPLTETPEGTVAAEALPEVLGLLKGKSVLLVGPGISTHPSTKEFVLGLLPCVAIPLVIDADGLNLISENPSILDSLKTPTVLTPHPGEFGRLLGMTTREVLEDRLDRVSEFAVKHGVYLVLKGHRTLTACPDGRVFVNPTGNPGMATGGSGDVLGGMIASQISQEKDIAAAVVSAVYLHGLSGDLAAADLGEKSLTAGDIIRYIPKAIKALEG